MPTNSTPMAVPPTPPLPPARLVPTEQHRRDRLQRQRRVDVRCGHADPADGDEAADRRAEAGDRVDSDERAGRADTQQLGRGEAAANRLETDFRSR